MSASNTKDIVTKAPDRDLEFFNKHLPLSAEIYRSVLEGYSYLNLRTEAVGELQKIPEPVFPEATEQDLQTIRYALNEENESLAKWAFNSFIKTFFEKNNLPASRKKRARDFLRNTLKDKGLPFSKTSDSFNMLVFIESRLQESTKGKSKLQVGTVVTVVNSVKSYHHLLDDSQYKGFIDKKEITNLYTVATALDLLTYRLPTDKKRLAKPSSNITTYNSTAVRCISSVLEILSENSLKKVKNSVATNKEKVGYRCETIDTTPTRRAVKAHILNEFKEAGVKVSYLEFFYSGLSGWNSESALHARNESAIYESLFKELVGELRGAPAKRYSTLLIPERKLEHKTVREFYITLRREYAILRAFGDHPETLKSEEDNPAELAFVKSILDIP